MKRLPALAAFLALAAMPLALGVACATTYGRDATNPACRTMRNSVPGAPRLPEPNRDDTRKAMGLAGGDMPAVGNMPVIRRNYAQAFELLQKIDGEGTDALAALPPDTPRLDVMIDMHVINLIWARTMLGTFYEQGRASRVDDGQAAVFFQKALDTRFVDDRGCVHYAPVATLVPVHLAGLYIYGEGVTEDRAKAKAILRQAGEGESILYLLDKDALPNTYAAYLKTNFDDLAEAVKNPPPPTWFPNQSMEGDAIFNLLGRVLLWFAVVVALFVAGVGLFRYIRRKQGHSPREGGDDASLYRTVFAIYDVIHGLVARFGLVAEGLVGCFLGLSILFGGYTFGGFGGFGNGFNLIVVVSGGSAFLGGIAKLIEAARVSAAPGNSLVHGAARPAAETEAQAAARGTAKTPDLHNRTFKE